MTAEAFADTLRARHVAPGRWIARCPAHRDHSPSLSIRKGRDGRVLLHCFTGCTVVAILGALGLASRDLYAGPPPSPEQARKAALERKTHERKQCARRRDHGAACEHLLKLERIVDELGRRLARLPEDAESGRLARLFDTALDKLRSAEVVERALRP